MYMIIVKSINQENNIFTNTIENETYEYVYENIFVSYLSS